MQTFTKLHEGDFEAGLLKIQLLDRVVGGGVLGIPIMHDSNRC